MHTPYIQDKKFIKSIEKALEENGYKIISIRTFKQTTFALLSHYDGFRIFSYKHPKYAKMLEDAKIDEYDYQNFLVKDSLQPLTDLIDMPGTKCPEGYAVPVIDETHTENYLWFPRGKKLKKVRNSNLLLDHIYTPDLNKYIYKHDEMHLFFFKNYSAFNSFAGARNDLDDWHSLLINIKDFNKFMNWIVETFLGSNKNVKFVSKKAGIAGGCIVITNDNYRNSSLIGEYLIDIVNIYNGFSDYNIVIEDRVTPNVPPKETLKYVMYGKEDCKYCVKLEEIIKRKYHSLEKKLLNVDYIKEDLQHITKSERPVNVVPHLFKQERDGSLTYIGGYVESLEYFANGGDLL